MGNICYVPQEGGEVATLSLGNPAAGANWLYTVPGDREYEIRCMQAKLTTSAVPGNRQPLFVIYDSGMNDLYRLYFSTTVPASMTAVFSLYRNCRRSDYYLLVSAGNSHYNDALPACRLRGGMYIGAAFSAMDVGDQWTEIRIEAHRWRS